MTNDSIKNGIKKRLLESEILCNKIQFSKIQREDKDIKNIGKITITLDSIDGVMLDKLKIELDDYLDSKNISYKGILLEI